MLNYKKPAFWLVTVAVIACTVVAVCFLTNPEEESNVPVSDPANIYGTYARGNESDPIPFTVTLWEDGVFQYYEAGISSHIGLGNYTFENGIVTLVDEAIPGVDGSLTRKYKFLYQDGNLVFLARESDKFTYITPPDCAVFQYVKPGDDVWKPEIGRK